MDDRESVRRRGLLIAVFAGSAAVVCWIVFAASLANAVGPLAGGPDIGVRHGIWLGAAVGSTVLTGVGLTVALLLSVRER